jgi:hypothetical protein
MGEGVLGAEGCDGGGGGGPAYCGADPVLPLGVNVTAVLEASVAIDTGVEGHKGVGFGGVFERQWWVGWGVRTQHTWCPPSACHRGSTSRLCWRQAWLLIQVCVGPGGGGA